jgi:hypothetical protein
MVGLASTIFQYDRLRIRLIPGPHVAADEIEIRSKTMLLNSNGLAAKDEELPRPGVSGKHTSRDEDAFEGNRVVLTAVTLVPD